MDGRMTPQDELSAAVRRDMDEAAKRGATRRLQRLREQAKNMDPMAELCRRVHQGQIKHGYTSR